MPNRKSDTRNTSALKNCWGAIKHVSQADQTTYLLKAREGDTQALEFLMQSYSSLITNRAHFYAHNSNVEADDLIQQGGIALIKAIKSCRYDLIDQFSNYAGSAIRNAMLDLLRIKKRKPISQLEDFIGDILKDEKAKNPTSSIINQEFSRVVRDAIESLKIERQKQVLRLHFGIDSDRPHSLAEIAEVIGVVRTNSVSLIRIRALQNIKGCSFARSLADFLPG